VSVINTFYDSEIRKKDIAITILASMSILLQTISNILGVSEKIINHAVVSNNFKFLYREIEKNVNLYNSAQGLYFISQIISDMVTVFEQNSPSLLHHFSKNKKYENLIYPENSFIKLDDNPHDFKTFLNMVDRDKSDSNNNIWWHKSIFRVLYTHQELKKYTDQENIGYYKSDADGSMIELSDNAEKFIGISKKNIKYPSGIGWISNLHKDDGHMIYTKWLCSIQKCDIFLQKYRFCHSHDIIHIIREAYPIYTRNGIYNGMEGMFLRIPDFVWNIIDIEEIKNKIYKNADRSYNYDQIEELDDPDPSIIYSKTDKRELVEIDINN
jgi:hypothetical protein